MSFQTIRDWVDLVLKGMSIAAIIGAGVWAIYQFEITDTDSWNIQLNISPEVIHIPKQKDGRLLVIHVKAKNIGKVGVSPAHFIVTVRDLDLQNGANKGAVDPAMLPERYKTDILDRYKDGYELEPGVEYDEIVALIVPKDRMYTIRSEMDLSDQTGDELDHTAITKVE